MTQRRHTVLDLPDLLVVPGIVRVRSELRGDRLHHIAVIDNPGNSEREVARAIERAREALKDVPEVIERMELNMSESASDTIRAAEAKRARRALG